MSTARIDDIVCIHLKRRGDRGKSFKKQGKKKNIPMRIMKAIENKKYPNLGKFMSHIQALKDARKRRSKSLLILEDDFKVIIPRLVVSPPPVEWDMLYLGGNVQKVLMDDDTDSSQHWKRVCCLMTHAYIVNGRSFGTIIREGQVLINEAMEALKKNDTSKVEELHLDQWYCNVMHPKLHTYMATPERVIQLDGYSDVKKREITYRDQLTGGAVNSDLDPPLHLSRPKVTEAIDKKTGQKYAELVIPSPENDDDLPEVALITCIHNQVDLFQFQQWSYYSIDYPRNKLTWLVVDDSSEELKVGPLVDGEDTSIKYVRCDMDKNAFISVSKKVNLAMKYLGPHTKYVMHMQPNFYYAPSHVRDRIGLMLGNSEFDCFGCTKYGVYDLTEHTSAEQTQPDGKGNPTMIFGPTLSYTKGWWEERNFDESKYTLETFHFIRGRWDRVLDIPYNLLGSALTHSGLGISESARYGQHGKATTSSTTGTAIARTAADSKKSTGARWDKYLEDGELTETRTAAVKKELEVGFDQYWDLTTKNMMLMLGGVITSDF